MYEGWIKKKQGWNHRKNKWALSSSAQHLRRTGTFSRVPESKVLSEKKTVGRQPSENIMLNLWQHHRCRQKKRALQKRPYACVYGTAMRCTSNPLGTWNPCLWKHSDAPELESPAKMCPKTDPRENIRKRNNPVGTKAIGCPSDKACFTG